MNRSDEKEYKENPHIDKQITHSWLAKASVNVSDAHILDKFYFHVWKCGSSYCLRVAFIKAWDLLQKQTSHILHFGDMPVCNLMACIVESNSLSALT